MTLSSLAAFVYSLMTAYDVATMTSRRLVLRRTTYIGFGLVGFLVGIGLARVVELTPGVVVVALIFVLLIFRRKSTLTLIAVTLLGISLGGLRGSSFIDNLQTYQELSKQPVIIRGIADTDAVYGDKSQLTFDLRRVELIEPYEQKLSGKVSIKGFGEPMVYRGDEAQVEGRLYPTRGSKQASISFADLKVTTPTTSRFEQTRRQFVSGLQTALPEPLGSFGLGLLVGQRNTLPKNFSDQLSAVGLTHLVAVSGYNLTILVNAAGGLAKKRSKYQTVVITLALIGSFLLLTNFSASIVRAAIVSLLTLTAWYYGRTISPIIIILTAAALTAGWYPIYLWSDIGWYLSFLAFSGVLIVAPLAARRLYKNRQPRLLGQIILESTAAQLMTLPLIMFIFGRVSLVALAANVLIVPLVPFAMFTALLAGLAGMFTASLAGWFAWPARLLLGYMADVVQVLAGVPNAQIFRSLHLGQMLFVYGLIGVLVLAWWTKSGKITDRNRLTDRSK